MPLSREVRVWAAEIAWSGVPVSFVLGRPDVQDVGGSADAVAERFVAAAQAQWFDRGEVLPLLEAFPDVQVDTTEFVVDVPEKRGQFPAMELRFHALVATPT